MKQKPFIHLFETSEGKYCYDVNTDDILKVSEETYKVLEGDRQHNNSQINKLEMAGYLKTNRVSISKHPMTDYLEGFYQNNLNALTLQVTQNCNLRCEYCIYSGKYNTRTHSNKRMSLELAIRGIDYLLEHSKYSKELSFGFYGGEPLLEFQLIKKCISYIETKVTNKKVNYLITTNATLLNPEIVEYLVTHNFLVTISFDGPKEIHDKYRKYAGNGKGTYDIVMKNVKYVRDHYYEFFKSNVGFNMVLNPQEGYKCIGEFIKGEEIVNDSLITSSIVSNIGRKEEQEISDIFFAEYNYEYFKLLLSKVGKVTIENVSSIVREDFNRLILMRGGKHRKGFKELPKEYHHSGPCIPGQRTLFLNIDGDFLPCERVCEKAGVAIIGNIVDGIDLEKAKRVLNIENIASEKCQNCWAYRHCTACIRFAEPDESHLKENMTKRCEGMKKTIENTFKDYCVLRALGYDFEVDKVKK